MLKVDRESHSSNIFISTVKESLAGMVELVDTLL